MSAGFKWPPGLLTPDEPQPTSGESASPDDPAASPPSPAASPDDPAASPDSPPESRQEPVRVHVFVDGRVQGVWFRQSTYQQAMRLGVRGWVRNLPDGRVEAVYEGPRAAVDQLLAWTRRGPDRAVVTSLEVYDEPPRGEHGFNIR